MILCLKISFPLTLPSPAKGEGTAIFALALSRKGEREEIYRWSVFANRYL